MVPLNTCIILVINRLRADVKIPKFYYIIKILFFRKKYQRLAGIKNAATLILSSLHTLNVLHASN
jgi:hypothetical protein